MSDFLTERPWGWYGAALVIGVIVVYGAAYYMASRPAQGIDYELADIDEQIDRPTLVGSGLDTADYDEIADDMACEFVAAVESWLANREIEGAT